MVEATNYNQTLVERKHGLKRNSQKNSSLRDNNSSWLDPNYALGPATLYWIILTGNKDIQQDSEIHSPIQVGYVRN